MSIRQIRDAQYETFTGQERFNLTLAALSRGDTPEATKLWQTCPWRNYSCMDMEYIQRMHSLAIIEAFFFQKVVLHYNMAQKAERFIMEWEYDLINDENENQADWAVKTREVITNINKARDRHISCLKGVIQGFRLFCVETGISHDDVLKAFPLEDCCPDLDWLLALDVPANNEHIQTVKSLFLESWGFEK